jgi:ABC-type transport system substrate-binding protein
MVDAKTVKPELEAKGVKAISEDSLVNWYVGFNMKDKVLQNKALRQAISSAIDRAQWIDTFGKHRGTPQNEVSPPGLSDRTQATTYKYDFNLKRAKELLAKAGFPDGAGLPVLNFDFRGADTKYRQMGEMFTQQLGAIGIKVNVILNTFPAYLEKAKQGNVQIFFGGWNYDYPDAENGYQLLYGPNKAPGPNDTSWESPQFDALYKQFAVMAAGAPGRVDVTRKMEAIVTEETPWAYGYFDRIYNLISPRLKNARVAEMIGNRFKYMRLEAPAVKK